MTGVESFKFVCQIPRVKVCCLDRFGDFARYEFVSVDMMLSTLN